MLPAGCWPKADQSRVSRNGKFGIREMTQDQVRVAYAGAGLKQGVRRLHGTKPRLEAIPEVN